MPKGQFVISIQPSDAEGCRIYYGAETAVGSVWQATPISTTTESTTPLNIDVSDSACSNSISGTLTNSNGAPIRYRQIFARASDWSQLAFAAPLEAEGEFAVAVPGDGRYLLSFELELGCTVFRTERGIVNGTHDVGDDDLITVAGENVRLDAVVPARPCGLPIRANVRDSEGMPRTVTDVQAYHKDTDTWTRPGNRDIDAGLFHLPVTPDTYRLYVELAHGCGGFATASSLTFSGLPFDQDQARQFQVADTPIDIDLQVPVGTCQYEIAGTLTHEDGSSTEGFTIWFERNGFSRAAQVSEDGTFGRVVRDPGNYILWYSGPGWPDRGCRVYVLGDAITLNPADAEQVEVVNGDVRRDIRIPAGTCEYQITGVVVDSNGASVTDVEISICGGGPGSQCQDTTSTAADGSFTLLAPINGSYSLVVRRDMHQYDVQPSSVSIYDSDVTGIVVTLVPRLESNDS